MVQETFIKWTQRKLADHAVALEPAPHTASNPEAWLFTVTRNRALRLIFRGAHPSRVLVSASRRDELSDSLAASGDDRPRWLRLVKFVSAGRQNQHAGRICSPDGSAG